MDLVEFLKLRADEYANKPLLISDDDVITYREFDERTDLIACGLSNLGIRRGDHVAVLHPNSPEVLLAYFGIIKMGAVVIPVNSSYTPREIKFILNNSDSRALLIHADFLSEFKSIHEDTPQVKQVIVRKQKESIEQTLDRMAPSFSSSGYDKHSGDDEPAIIFYTSGTTGNPKGVILSHRNFSFGGPNIAQSYGLSERDRTIAVLPMVHVFSVASPFFGSLSTGGSVVVIEKFKTDLVLDAIRKHEVTWFPGVPTMFTYLLSAASEKEFNQPSLRMGLSGGASLPVEVLKNWESCFKAKVIEVYGLTESTGLVTANPVYGVRKPGSIGINVSGVDVKVVDKGGNEVATKEVGELIFRGPNATKGYYKLTDETSQKIRNGWIHTGDHAWRDDDGYFYIVGREKELIICGGYNIYPREIEEVLHAIEGVSEVAVIGVPDPMKGEIPKAYVTLRTGAKVTEQTILDHCRRNLANYKIPKIQFLADLPKNPTGKILKKELPRE